MTGTDSDPKGVRRRVGLACSEDVRRRCVADEDLARLSRVADFSFRSFTVASGREGPAPRDPEAESELGEFSKGLDVLMVCDGSPFVSSAVLASSPRLTLLAELDGDRFGYRLDVSAAWERGIRVVDSSQGSSWPTAEWALGLALIGLRNAGGFFRRMIAHEQTEFPVAERTGPGYDEAELSHKRLGMVGFGHLARRLVELLRPFDVEIRVFDPFVPQALATTYGIEFAPLPIVLDSSVVFVLVPHTANTEGMIGKAELDQIPTGGVLVNVSRGKVIDTAALLDRLRRGDLIACLDVFDPEPVPLDSPFLDLPNVFLTPHIAGVTAESRRRFFSLAVDECLRHFEGLDSLAELTPEVVELRNAPDVSGARRS
jgi:D-3-phosphoglycerate dehydrogenase / 2-oxoglutarate reductase